MERKGSSVKDEKILMTFKQYCRTLISTFQLCLTKGGVQCITTEMEKINLCDPFGAVYV